MQRDPSGHDHGGTRPVTCGKLPSWAVARAFLDARASAKAFGMPSTASGRVWRSPLGSLAHAREGGSDGFRLDLTGSTHIGQLNLLAVAQMADAIILPRTVWHVPRITVATAARLSHHSTIGAPGATSQASATPRSSAKTSSSKIPALERMNHSGAWVLTV